MSHVDYREVCCKSALNRVGGMPFKWSLNPYRGCLHACTYCFARATHRYFDLGVGEDFAGIIFVKTNLPEMLAEELSRRTWKREQVAIGTATDPYQPIEGRYGLTRRCLEILGHFRTPASVVTKGTLVVRDVDVLQDLTRRAGVTVCFSVPTVDREIWRRTEPGTPPPEQRLKAMERLASAGIRAGILMAPLLPGLSAVPEQIERTVRAAADHGACFIGSQVLHLGPDVRDYFLSFLTRAYPDLLATYQRLYGTKYAPKQYQLSVEHRLELAKAAAGFGEDHHRPIDVPGRAEQLALPLLAAVARSTTAGPAAKRPREATSGRPTLTHRARPTAQRLTCPGALARSCSSTSGETHARPRARA